jgi:hypothetical protein
MLGADSGLLGLGVLLGFLGRLQVRPKFLCEVVLEVPRAKILVLCAAAQAAFVPSPAGPLYVEGRPAPNRWLRPAGSPHLAVDR